MDFQQLKRLCDTPGIPGREEAVRDIAAAEMTGLGFSIEIDALGNLIGRKPGNGLRLALAAHMDEVGFVVGKIEEGGFLRIMPVGGIDPRVVSAREMIVHGTDEIRAVVGSVPPHLTGVAAKTGGPPPAEPIESLFLDTGLDARAVFQKVRIGDPVTFAVRAWETETSILAKALDDRVGVFAMLSAAAKCAAPDCDLTLIASVQEEYGLRGAGPAAFRVAPDVLVALEGTFAADTPGMELPKNLTPTELGKGPEIRLLDRAAVSDRRLFDFLIETAESAGISYQPIVKKWGTTDATAAQVAGKGVRTCAVSVPVRYIHAPVGVARKSDIEQTTLLIAALLETADRFSNR